MEFGKQQKNNGKVSPISMYFEWKNDKKNIDKLILLKSSLDDKTISAEEKSMYEKQIAKINEEKLYSFVGWNKELEMETKVIPDQFILLSATNCIKGWDDATNSGIYSNEITNLKEQELIAKCSKGDRIAYKGLYNKELVSAAGLKFYKGLVVQEGDNIHEYYLSGSSLMQFNNDLENIDRQNYKIKLGAVEERKKGTIIYYVPIWVQGDKITDSEREQAIQSWELLEEYRKPNGD